MNISVLVLLIATSFFTFGYARETIWRQLAERRAIVRRGLLTDMQKNKPQINLTWTEVEQFIKQRTEEKGEPTKKLLTCYYSYEDDLLPHQLDANLCTHLILIGNCMPFPNGTLIQFPNRTIVAELLRLRAQNPNMKLMISMTSFNANWPFSEMVKSNEKMASFAKLVRTFFESSTFDGFDLDWEFPVFHDGQKTDKRGFSKLLKHLRSEFNKSSRHIVMSAAVGSPWTIIDASYEVAELNKYLDFINIMHYDMHEFHWYEPFTGHNAPLFKKTMELWLLGRLNTAYSTVYWYKKGMEFSKIVVGLPSYARGFELMFESLHKPYSPAVGYSKFGDDLTYSQVCDLVNKKGYRRVWDDSAKVPYIYQDKQWISFEDTQSALGKAKWINQMNWAGAMVFSLNCDDFTYKCSNETFPIIRTLQRELIK